jgi:hypothetical protein
VVTYWLFCVSANDGSLYIFNIARDNSDEEMRDELSQSASVNLIYSCPKFSSAPKTLIPNEHFFRTSLNPLTSEFSVPPTFSSTHSKNEATNANLPAHRVSSLIDSSNQSNATAVSINEILVLNMANYAHLDVKNPTTRPLLVAKCDEDLIIYEAFLAASNQTNLNSNSTNVKSQKSASALPLNASSQINFKRINHEIVIRDKRVNSGGSKRKAAAAAQNKNKANEVRNHFILI